MEALLAADQSTHRPVSLQVARPGHTMGHCKLKSSPCTVQQVCWSLHWVLRPGWAGGCLWGLRFCGFLEFSR